MNKNKLVAILCKGKVLFQDGHLVLRVLVQADFTDAQHVVGLHELRNDAEYLGGEADIFGFLRIDAQPTVVVDAVLRGASRFCLGELAEIVPEALHRAPVEACPECRLGDRDAACLRHPAIVVCGAGHHVDVGIDVIAEASVKSQNTDRTTGEVQGCFSNTKSDNIKKKYKDSKNTRNHNKVIQTNQSLLYYRTHKRDAH